MDDGVIGGREARASGVRNATEGVGEVISPRSATKFEGAPPGQGGAPLIVVRSPDPSYPGLGRVESATVDATGRGRTPPDHIACSLSADIFPDLLSETIS